MPIPEQKSLAKNVSQEISLKTRKFGKSFNELQRKRGDA